jgi:xylulokinase
MVGLKGEDACVDYTFIHFSGFSDAQNGRWSDELCELMGVDKENYLASSNPGMWWEK